MTLSKKSFKNQLLLLSLGNVLMRGSNSAVLLLLDSQTYFFYLISMVLEKQLKLFLANGLTIVTFRIDGGVPAGFRGVLPESKTIGDAGGVLLEHFADASIDDLVAPVYNTRIDQCLPVVLARKEVFQVLVRQGFIKGTFIQR
jgi:hypothetical protein